MYLRYLALALLGILVTLVAVLLSPVLPVFIRAGQYPAWLSWFQTADAPAYGDSSFRAHQMAWAQWMPEWLFFYVAGVMWQIRNPGYGYDAAWAGLTVTAGFIYSHEGREDTNIGRDAQGNVHLVEGRLVRHLVNGDGREYFEKTWLHRWSSKRAWRITIGWHLHPTIEVGAKRLLRVTVNPWMSLIKD